MSLKNILPVLILGFCHGVFGQQSDTLFLSMESAMELAEKNHSIYQSQLLDGQIYDQEMNQASAKKFPQITAVADIRYNFIRPTTILPGSVVGKPGEDIAVKFGNNWNNIAGLELEQFVFDAQLLEDLKILKLSRRLPDIRAGATLQELKISVIRSYLQILIAQKRAAQATESARRAENTVALANAKVTAELLNPIEAERARLNLENAHSMISKNEQTILLSQQLLNFALGIPLDKPVVLTEDLKNIDDLKADYLSETMQPTNLERQPTLQLQNLQRSILDAQIKKQGKANLPTASVYGYLGTNGQGNNLNYFDSRDVRWFGNSYLGLKINWRLNSLFENRRILPQLQLKKQQNALQLQANKNEISVAVAKALTTLKIALEDVLIQKRKLEFSKKELDYLTIRFRSDLAEAKELIDAEQVLVTAQERYWEVYYSYLAARWELRKERGML